jgi:hypothetical protein
LTKVYGDPPELGNFADLLVSHELGHVTHLADDAAWDDPDVWWLKELAANLALQGYATEVEPEVLLTLETLCEVTWAAPQDAWPIRDLARMGDAAEADGSNYCWFEFGLQILAGRLWTTAGVASLRGVVDLLRGPRRSDDAILGVIAELDAGVARDLAQWPNFPA